MLATPTITVENGPWGPHNKVIIPRGNMNYYNNPPGFFTTFKANSDVMLTGIYPQEATDGRGVISSDQYKALHHRSTSLQCTESDSKYISFFSVLSVQLNLDKLGAYHDLVMIPLYQSHVLWCYMPRITVVEDGKYSMSLRSVGPHLSEVIDGIDESSDEDSEYSDDSEDSGPKNVPPGQTAPPIANAFLWIADGDCVTYRTSFDFVPSADGSLVVEKSFTREELLALTYDGRHVIMCWNIIVPRFYFDLSSVIDLTMTPTVPASATATVEKILRGEKPHGWDFKIMGGFLGSGDTSVVYYMHSAALESKSPTAKKAAATFPASENKGGRVSLDAYGLAAAVQIAYGVEVPLPKTFERNMAITLEGMFEDHFTSVVVPQWEREICRRALALDVRNPSSSSMVELLRLLNAIWEMPYGYFPVAKRVAVGVPPYGRSTMHVGPHANVLDFVQNTVLPSFHESGMNPTNLLTIQASLAIHLNTIPHVSKSRCTTTENPIRISNKSGAASTKTVEKETEQTLTTPPSESTHVVGPDCAIGTGAVSTIDKTVEKETEQTLSSPPSEPTHVELEMPPIELPYPEPSTDIDSASVPATRSCSIL